MALAKELLQTYNMKRVRAERPDEARMLEVLASGGATGLAKALGAGMVLPALALLGLPAARAAEAATLMRLLERKACPSCRLQDADLVLADLRDADLRKAQLQRANLSQAQLAEQAGISKRTLERLEAGASATQLSLFLRVLRQLDLLERLDLLIPEPQPSPLALLELQKAGRKRASRRRIAKPTSTWTWGQP